MYLLVLTALFCVGAAALWAAVPKTAAGDYLITAAEPEDGGTGGEAGEHQHRRGQ